MEEEEPSHDDTTMPRSSDCHPPEQQLLLLPPPPLVISRTTSSLLTELSRDDVITWPPSSTTSMLLSPFLSFDSSASHDDIHAAALPTQSPPFPPPPSSSTGIAWRRPSSSFSARPSSLRARPHAGQEEAQAPVLKRSRSLGSQGCQEEALLAISRDGHRVISLEETAGLLQVCRERELQYYSTPIAYVQRLQRDPGYRAQREGCVRWLTQVRWVCVLPAALMATWQQRIKPALSARIHWLCVCSSRPMIQSLSHMMMAGGTGGGCRP